MAGEVQGRVKAILEIQTHTDNTLHLGAWLEDNNRKKDTNPFIMGKCSQQDS